MFKNGMRPVHPGEVLLKDYILPMGISVRALSLALQVPYPLLREIVDGKRGVSADIALRLDRYFGSGARGWLNLQAAYDLVGPVDTVHLLRSRKNAERLLTALRRARS